MTWPHAFLSHLKSDMATCLSLTPQERHGHMPFSHTSRVTWPHAFLSTSRATWPHAFLSHLKSDMATCLSLTPQERHGHMPFSHTQKRHGQIASTNSLMEYTHVFMCLDSHCFPWTVQQWSIQSSPAQQKSLLLTSTHEWTQ